MGLKQVLCEARSCIVHSFRELPCELLHTVSWTSPVQSLSLFLTAHESEVDKVHLVEVHLVYCLRGEEKTEEKRWQGKPRKLNGPEINGPISCLIIRCLKVLTCFKGLPVSQNKSTCFLFVRRIDEELFENNVFVAPKMAPSASLSQQTRRQAYLYKEFLGSF